jgi:hypothetical protein
MPGQLSAGSRIHASVISPAPRRLFHFSIPLITCFSVDATRALLIFIRSADAALELEPGALS